MLLPEGYSPAMEPKRPPSRALLLFWLLPCLLSLAATLWVILVAARWVRGGECRTLLENHSSSVLHAKLELDPIALTWLGITSPKAKATGVDGGILKALRAEGIRADIRPTSILKGYWDVERISMEKLHLHFGEASPTAHQDSVAPASSRLPGWMPSRTVIGVIHGAKTDMLIGLPQGRSFLLEGSRMEWHPGETRSRVNLTGGILTSPQYPDLSLTLRAAEWILSGNHAELVQADLSSPQGGSIRISGNLRGGDGVSGISGSWKDLPARILLPKFSDKISGTFSGESSSSWSSSGQRDAHGEIRSDDLVLNGIPSFSKLAEVSGLPGFRSLRITRFESRYVMRNGVTRWEDFLIEAPGYLKVTGTAETTEEGKISGTFRFGITTRIVSMIPFARELLGLDERDGYIWTREPVAVGGTLSHPEENLTPRISMLMAAGATGLIRNGIREGMEILGIRPENHVGGEGTSTAGGKNPATEAEKAAGRVLDSASGFLR